MATNTYTPIAEFGDNLAHDHCRWCGKQLRPVTRLGWSAEPVKIGTVVDLPCGFHRSGGERYQGTAVSCAKAIGPGYSIGIDTGLRGYDQTKTGGDTFCTLRCGFSYAKAALKNGYRLQPKK